VWNQSGKEPKLSSWPYPSKFANNFAGLRRGLQNNGTSTSLQHKARHRILYPGGGNGERGLYFVDALGNWWKTGERFERNMLGKNGKGKGKTERGREERGEEEKQRTRGKG
jgi:hypothetical protein